MKNIMASLEPAEVKIDELLRSVYPPAEIPADFRNSLLKILLISGKNQ